jgi:hypothetical protein
MRWMPSRHGGWPKIVECLINLGERKMELRQMVRLHFIVARKRRRRVSILLKLLRTIQRRKTRDRMQVRLVVMVAMMIKTVIIMMRRMMKVMRIVMGATPRKNHG